MIVRTRLTPKRRGDRICGLESEAIVAARNVDGARPRPRTVSPNTMNAPTIRESARHDGLVSGAGLSSGAA